jgi:Mannosylglycerate hydrolase MGH1-like glycoside hydrolase domain
VAELLGPIYRPDQRSWLIDPPVPAYAAAMIADASRPEDEELLDSAAAHLEATERLRAVDGLLSILHPLESGTDVSPTFDALLDVSSSTALLKQLQGFARALAAIEYSIPKAVETKHAFIVADPTFCGWHLLALEELAAAWARFGHADKAEATLNRAHELCDAMARLMWDERQNLFVGYDHVAQRQLTTPTMGGVIAAASQCMRERGLSQRVVGLLRPGGSGFVGQAGLSFNPITGEAPNHGGMLWRGDVVSAANHYWAYNVLQRQGEPDLAEHARTQLEALIAISGFREFYDAESGEGVGAGSSSGFTWPALVLDMGAETEP